MIEDELDTLSDIKQLWDSASAISDLQEQRWAKNEKLARSLHLTPRKVGQSNLFVPKIEAMHYRKRADHLFSLAGDAPVSLKPTLTSTDNGAKIMERVCNYYIKEAGGINWESAVLNVASDSLTYNFAPFFVDWDRDVEKFEVEVDQLDAEGNLIVAKVEDERELYSYATLESIPPEDFRIDPSVGWDEVGMARFGIIRRWRDKSFAKKMERLGVWDEIDEGLFESGFTSTTGNTLKTERAHQNSPFSYAIDIDNGLLEVWYSYYYEEDEDGDYVPVVTVSLADKKILEAPTPLEFNLSNQDGSDPFPFGIGRIYYTPHEMYDRAMPEKLESAQIEVNAIRNQRRDNVSLVLNREKFMTPEAGIDPAVLSRSYSGKVNVVANRNSVWWDAPPDVTASSYNEETAATADMERLVAESAQRAGVSSGGSTTATESKIVSANSSASTTLDASVLKITFAVPFVTKLIRMIRQAADPALFEAAAIELNVQSQDPYAEALEGDFNISVGAGAMQAAKQAAIADTSNTAAILQSIYGNQANYYPIVKPMLEALGLKVDDVIQNPLANQQQPHPSQTDAGGIQEDVSKLTSQPNVVMQGGGDPAGNGRTV